MGNVVYNAIALFVIFMFIIIFGIAFSVVDRVNNQTNTIINSTLRDTTENFTVAQNETKIYYTDVQALYTPTRSLFLEVFQFIITMTIAFVFLSSFSHSVNLFEYLILFVAAVIVSAIINYTCIEIYNSMSSQFYTLNLSTDFFFAYFINNIGKLLIFNLLAFLGQFVWIRFQQGGAG